MPALGRQTIDALSVLFARTSEEDYASAIHAYGEDAACNAPWGDGGRLQAPSFEEYRHFFNQVLTPGVPGSLPPVESLYRDWGGHRAGLQHGQGFYLGPSAAHVRQVCEQLDISIPTEFDAMPDHLIILIELNEFLCEHAPVEQTRAFADEHFSWLPVYRGALASRMAERNDDQLAVACTYYDAVLGFLETVLLQGYDAFEAQTRARSA